MRRAVAAAYLVCITWVTAAAAGVPTLPFRDVRAGMKGTGKTVFEGTRVETFDVEIVGTLPNIGPDQDLILGRLSGGPLADTGVLAGMSGSPVFVDGKLIGALAYAWGFAKEAIAGITPIEEMLALASLDVGPPPGRRATSLAPGDLERLRGTEHGLTAFLSTKLPSRLVGPSGIAPMALPLVVSGVGPRGFARMAPGLAGAGFLPVQGAGAGQAPAESPPLEPGSAMGLKLIRGDVDLTATGTVTWVDDDRLLGFGHPLFGLGPVDLPLTGARVELLLASLQRSARMATPLSEVGAIRQDRTAGVFGRLGAQPNLLPVRVQLSGPTGEQRSYSFDVADDPLLSPLLLYASLNGILASRERAFGSATLRLREGSVIKMIDEEDVRLDNLFSGPTAFEYSTGLPAYILYLLMNNDWRSPGIAGINLLMEYHPDPSTGRIRRASLDRYRVRPGDAVEVRVVVDPYRGPEQLLTREILIPPGTPPGPLQLDIGAGLRIDRAEAASSEPLMPRDLSQLIWLINHLRRNDRVFVTAYSADSGVFLDGARLPNLPPSAARILSRPRTETRGSFSRMQRRGILEEEIPTAYAVEGLTRIRLEVEAP